MNITNNDRMIYNATRRIADLFYEGVRPGGYVENRKGESVNEFYNQTTEGLFIEFYYGHPSRIYTPWGKWGFVGSSAGDVDTAWAHMLKHMTVEIYTEKTVNYMGEFGPVYRVLSLDGVPLPYAEMRELDSYLTYENACEIWRALTDLYTDTQNFVHLEVNSERKEYFFTKHHGHDDPKNWYYTDKSLPGPGRWMSITYTIPHNVVPRPGFEDGLVKTREDVIKLYHSDEREVQVADLIKEIP